MNYALIENGIVINVIWLLPDNAEDFPTAVPMGDVLAAIGDEYKDGEFYRDGNKVLTTNGYYELYLKEASEIIEELDAALLDATYESIIGGLE